MAEQCCRHQLSLEQALRELFEFKTLQYKIGFETKNQDLKQFVTLLNCVVDVEDIRRVVENHQCHLDCFVCVVKKCLMDFRDIEIDGILHRFKTVAERIKKCRGYGGYFDLVLSLFGLKNKLKVLKKYECGYSESIVLKVFIFNVDGFVEEVDKYFRFFNLTKSSYFLHLNSTFIKKSRRLNDQFFDELRQTYCQNNESIHSTNCCRLESGRFSIKLPCFGFRLIWKDMKNLEFKIAQLCVGLSGTLSLTDETFYLSRFYSKRENDAEEFFCWRTPDGSWNISINDEKIFNLSWVATIVYLMMHRAKPVFLVYQKTSLPDMSLSDEEVIKLEHLSYATVNGIYCLCVTKIFHQEIPNESTVDCFACGNQKYEGFECENCGFLEQNWTCECGFYNLYVNLSCQNCNRIKWFAPNSHFHCEKCKRVSEKLRFCQYCPAKKCYKCKGFIFGGQVLSCRFKSYPAPAYLNRCDCTLCLNCMT